MEINRLDEIRQRYKKIFYQENNREEAVQPIVLSPEEIEQAQRLIDLIEEKINNIKNLPKRERRHPANHLLRMEFKEIDKFQLTMEQAEKLNSLIHRDEFKYLEILKGDNIIYRIRDAKKIAARKLIEAVKNARIQTNEKEELEYLSLKITQQILAIIPMIASVERDAISKQLTKIKQQESSYRLRNEISEDIENIIIQLSQGNLDIVSAKKVIEEEAKKRFENRPKTIFRVTEDQEKNQVLIQIKTFLKERADKYPIQNPYITVMQLQELTQESFIYNSLNTVIENMLERKEFKEAKKTCDKFLTKKKVDEAEPEINKYIRRTKKEIIRAEIGDFVLKGLHMKESKEKEEEYFELIQKGLEKANIKLEEVPLGKTEDSSRSITLADIWLDNEERIK